MRSLERKSRPVAGGGYDLTWRANRDSLYGYRDSVATLPPLMDLHLGSDFLSGWTAGRAAQ